MRYVVLLTFLIIGCGSQMDHRSKAKKAPPRAVDAKKADTNKAMPAGKTNAKGPALPSAAIDQANQIKRKIVYNANIKLVVEDFNQLQEAVENLVEKQGGFIAGSNLSGTTGSRRSGTWRIRIPVDNFRPSMAAIRRLGELENEKTDSQEVTEEFYDIQARLKNKERHRDGLQELERHILEQAKTRDTKLEDMLKLKDVVVNVQGEIERLQGRLRVLLDRTSLATITLTARELKDYVPPRTVTPPQPATFGTRISKAFFSSVDTMVTFFQNLAIGIALIGSWLILITVLLIVVYFDWWIWWKTHN